MSKWRARKSGMRASHGILRHPARFESLWEEGSEISCTSVHRTRIGFNLLCSPVIEPAWFNLVRNLNLDVQARFGYSKFQMQLKPNRSPRVRSNEGAIWRSVTTYVVNLVGEQNLAQKCDSYFCGFSDWASWILQAVTVIKLKAELLCPWWDWWTLNRGWRSFRSLTCGGCWCLLFFDQDSEQRHRRKCALHLIVIWSWHERVGVMWAACHPAAFQGGEGALK